MSRSWKKNPGFYDRNPFMKRQANKKIRKIPVFDESLGSGRNYRKHFCSYDICDYRFRDTKSFNSFVRERLKLNIFLQQREYSETPFEKLPEHLRKDILKLWYQAHSN